MRLPMPGKRLRRTQAGFHFNEAFRVRTVDRQVLNARTPHLASGQRCWRLQTWPSDVEEDRKPALSSDQSASSGA